MDERQARWEINATLREKGFKHVGPGSDQYRGQIRVGHVTAEIELQIPDLSFAVLPRIEFIDRKALPLSLIAHLEQGTGLCYADGTLLRLDRYAPGAAILRVLAEAEKTIGKSFSGRALVEISQEFPLYWKGGLVQVLIPANNVPARGYIAAAKRESASEVPLLVSRERAVPAGFSTTRKVAIVKVSSLVPVDPFLAPHTLAELEIWHSCQSATSRSVSDVMESLARQEVVFYQAQNGWVGCEVELPAHLKLLLSKQNSRPEFIRRELLRRKDTIKLQRYMGSEASLDHVTSRNLGQIPSLKGKRIALVGCGTIGSHLARYLVQSGAGNEAELLLIDNQTLAAGNLGRHLLNFDAVGKGKAQALAAELQRFHPDVRLTPLDGDGAILWPRFESADLIIDATGVEMFSDALNARAIDARSVGRSCQVLHVWLFANGTAAQSFLNVGGDFACYRCLRPDLSRPWINDPRKDVKDGGNVAPASCGEGPYLPFAVDAPVTAAAIALRSILGFFGGRSDPRLRTALIDAAHANHLDDKSPRRRQECPACR